MDIDICYVILLVELKNAILKMLRTVSLLRQQLGINKKMYKAQTEGEVQKMIQVYLIERAKG